MALFLSPFPISSPSPKIYYKTSFLQPPPCIRIIIIRRRRRSNPSPTTTTSHPVISSFGVPKIVRHRPLDRHASKHSRLRFATKLQTLLLSKPRHFLPLRVLDRCRPYLGLPSSRRLLPMILRYPSLFHLFPAPSHTSPTLSLLSVTLTPAASALAAQSSLLRSRLASSLASKLHRLLMLAAPPHHRILLSKLAHIAPDLGLPVDFRSALCNAHPSRFRTVHTSYGRALELVSIDPNLSTPFPPVVLPSDARHSPIIDRPPKFKQLHGLRRGLNLKRRHKDSLIRFHELPAVSPYLAPPPAAAASDAAERRACAAVREVLAMTVEKRTLVDHLTHFRRELGLPNRLRAMLVRHPEMFYVSVKGLRDSVFLAEAYDDRGRLLVEDEMLSIKERLMELVREGKRMRREMRRGTLADEDEEDEEEEEEDEEDGFNHLFDPEIGDDWEDLVAVPDVDGLEELGEVDDFWTSKASAEWAGVDGRELEAW